MRLSIGHIFIISGVGAYLAFGPLRLFDSKLIGDKLGSVRNFVESFVKPRRGVSDPSDQRQEPQTILSEGTAGAPAAETPVAPTPVQESPPVVPVPDVEMPNAEPAAPA